MNELERDLKERLRHKPILLMTHLMLGYPSFAVNRELVGQMAAGGVDCIELQIPFSEPIADGPAILQAGRKNCPGCRGCPNCSANAAMRGSRWLWSRPVRWTC